MNKLTTTIPAINNGGDTLILVGKSDHFLFSDGKKTEKIGTKFSCVAPGNRLSDITVKIEGVDPLPQISDEDIVKATSAMAFPLVRLTNAVVSLYTMNGTLGITVTAEGATLVEPKR